LKSVFSVFNRRPMINVRSAPPEVLRALFGLDEEQLAQLTEQRAQGLSSIFPVLEGMLADPVLAELLSDETPNLLVVDVQAQMPGSSVPARVAAVIDLGESNEGVYILRWYDQLPVVDGLRCGLRELLS
jgi:hypothetical protein